MIMNEISNDKPFNDFLAAMREELQQYGEMLARFDDIDRLRICGSAQDQLTNAVLDQAKVIQNTRRQRTKIESTLAHRLGVPSEGRVEELVNFVPPIYQPLVQALTNENNDLPVRIRQRAFQSDPLLAPFVISKLAS
jgi:hypothetical protein